jgi:hypothetical protein
MIKVIESNLRLFPFKNHFEYIKPRKASLSISGRVPDMTPE